MIIYCINFHIIKRSQHFLRQPNIFVLVSHLDTLRIIRFSFNGLKPAVIHILSYGQSIRCFSLGERYVIICRFQPAGVATG